MRSGVILPGGTAPQQLEQAVLAEQSGWDGVFVWEAPYGVDAWTLLAAIAARTSRVRLGTMLTPLPWRRPWKVASQVVTLDQLSNGRATLAVGLGATDTADLPSTGEELDRRKRAETLDEGSSSSARYGVAAAATKASTSPMTARATISLRPAGRCRNASRSGSSAFGRAGSRCVAFSGVTA